jgi:arylsulfatase A-like enzyme
MMGDHGLLWKGPYTFQGCINIPTMVAPPAYGEGARGRVSDALIAQVDLLPSVLEACGVPMPGAAWRDRATPFERGSLRDLALFPGRSWLPMVRGAASASRESVVIENDDPTTGYRVRCLVTDRYRLTIYPGTSHGELFDLRDDPDELHNLWYQDHVRALRLDLVAELLDAYALETPLYPIPVWNS